MRHHSIVVHVLKSSQFWFICQTQPNITIMVLLYGIQNDYTSYSVMSFHINDFIIRFASGVSQRMTNCWKCINWLHESAHCSLYTLHEVQYIRTQSWKSHTKRDVNETNWMTLASAWTIATIKWATYFTRSSSLHKYSSRDFFEIMHILIVIVIMIIMCTRSFWIYPRKTCSTF